MCLGGSELPRGSHQAAEQVVILHLSRHGRVVVAPVIPGDRAVVELVAEGREELNEHVVQGASAVLNAGMVGRLEALLQLGGDNHFAGVGVEFVEGLLNHSLASFVGLSTDANQELAEVNVTVAGGVQKVEEHAGLFLSDGAAEVLKAPVKLLLVDVSVVVDIHDGEGLAKRAHAVLVSEKLVTNLGQN